jgi:hypothetical protein
MLDVDCFQEALVRAQRVALQADVIAALYDICDDRLSSAQIFDFCPFSDY